MTYFPHSGYHWHGQSPFFEGWYVRLILPESGITFAFMYSIENPAGDLAYGGGAVQILGPSEQLKIRTFPDVTKFWAKLGDFSLGHWGQGSPHHSPKPLPEHQFWQQIPDGYQVHRHHHQGQIRFIDSPCRWQFQIFPQSHWGNYHRPAQATAGWLSFLPLFDPGWQVLLAKGRAAGWIEWQSQKYQFTHAIAYAEKNWGTSFPSRWFWVQANDFADVPSLSVTAAAGERLVLGQREEVGLIGIHWRGRFYEFAPWTGKIRWQVSRWGRWELQGTNSNFWVILEGKTDQAGTWVYTPTAKGLQLNCRDTTQGILRLRLGHHYHGLMVDTQTKTAGLEVGGNWGK
ncbi:MAG: tocopherol cyclase family protein [Synechocystis sp.]|nr:tocopherol cyclase family protein [Synechocystis sp.]